MSTRTTEVWFRNPASYIREIVAENARLIAWDRGFTHKRSLDPVAHARMYFPDYIPYRILHVGVQGTAEYRKGDTLDKPCAVYPTWAYGEDLSLLEEMMHVNIVDTDSGWDDPSLPADERAVVGQEHRVVVTDLPAANVGAGRRILRQLQELQEEYPDCLLHIHGLYSFRICFGFGFRAADIEVRSAAHSGEVMLPNGKTLKYEQTRKCPQWVTLLGYDINRLDVPAERCKFNIRSALWAGEHFQENVKFKVAGSHVPDITSPKVALATTKAVHSTPKPKEKPSRAQEGDKVLCDTCSLQNSCKYYRLGGVCAIPDSEVATLALQLGTRDSSMIIEGLSKLMTISAGRLERALETEELEDVLDPAVTGLINSMFANGVKLAKLVNPQLAGGPKVGVFVNGGNAAVVTQGNAGQVMAGIVAELEASGIPREQITEEMVINILTGGPQNEAVRGAIDATVVERSA